MSELQRFLPEEQDLLVGLFYRIGAWISGVDDTDIGNHSEEQEQKKLYEILRMLSNNKKSALVADIASEALRQSGNHARWHSATDDVLADVASAKRTIKGQATGEETIAFSKALMLIATAVAKAFREENDLKENTGYISWLNEKIADITLAITDNAAYADMNISPAEDSALNELREVLRG